MRLLTIDDLSDGMILGKTIFGADGKVMLRKGVVLRAALIEGIRRLKFSSVYIDDDFSKDIDVQDIITEELRRESVLKVKSFFTSVLTEPSNYGQMERNIAEIGSLINEIIDQILSNRKMVVNLIDLKSFDEYTYQHSVNVSVLSTVLGLNMGFSPGRLKSLATSGILHDIGKQFIPKGIISKQGPLTQEELDRVMKHPVYGFELIKKLNLNSEVAIGVLSHHERYSGCGYPHGRKGEGIHINAQIIAISDVFDAMTSKRSYHDAILPSEAMEYIMANADQHFSRKLVDVFIQKVAAYPVGATVTLSDGRQAVVCENTEGLTMRPKVKIVAVSPEDCVYINLAEKENSAITISGMGH